MSRLDFLTGVNFDQTANGWIFLPWGAMGKGYALPDRASYRRIRTRLNALYVAGPTLLIVVEATLGGAAFGLAAAAWITGLIAFPLGLASALAVSPHRMSFIEASHRNRWWIWLALVAVPLLMLDEIWQLARQPDHGAWPWVIVFIGLLALAGCATLLVRTRKRAGDQKV